MTRDRLRHLSILLMAAFTVLLVAIALAHCRHGLEFTDEGFYFNWIVDPWRYPFSATMFGFVYYPLYEILDGNLVLLRQANVVLTLSLAFILALVVTQQNGSMGQRVSRDDILTAIVLATPSMMMFLWGVATPSYNTLIFQASMVSATGLIAGAWTTRANADIFAMAVGLGGAIAILAKPSSAVLLGIAAFAFTIASVRNPLRFLLVASAASAGVALLAMVLISDDVAGFYERLHGGYENLNILVPRYGVWSILRLDPPKLTRIETIGFIFATGAALAIIYWVGVKPTLATAINLGLTAWALIVGAVCFLYPSVLSGMGEQLKRTGLIIGAAPLAVLIAAVATRIHAKSAPPPEFDRRIIACSVLLAVVPLTAAAGTATNSFQQMTLFSFFWIIAAFTFARVAFPQPVAQTTVVTILASGLAITTAIVTAGSEIPYRQSSALRLQQTPIRVGAERNQVVLVDGETARYVKETMAELDAHGFRVGDGIIDLTGESPGVIHALGGKALGEPWILGRYVGSADFAARSLATIPCSDFARAWILSAPRGRRSIPNSVLLDNGITPGLDIAKIRVRSSDKFHTIAAVVGAPARCSNPR